LNLIGQKKGIQRMAKNKWYKRSHWTYKENRGWLMERGIVAFHWSDSQGFYWSICKREKWNVLWGNSQKFPCWPRDVSEEKTLGKPGEKKVFPNYLPYTSRYVTPYKSFLVTSGDAISGHCRWRYFQSLPVRPLPVTSFPVMSLLLTTPPQIRARFNMTYY
jgi:hypothetical protein